MSRYAPPMMPLDALDEWRVFPLLFGSGNDGDITISSDTDGGCVGSFGFKQARNLTIDTGIKLWAPPGSSNGGIVLAVSDTLTLNGSIIADGGNGTNGVYSGFAGTGGAGAGGPTGPSGLDVESNGFFTSFSVGCIGGGPAGGSGAFCTSNSVTKTGGAARCASVNAAIVAAFAASGLPYQQTTETVTPASPGLGTVLSRAWCRWGLVGGASGKGGDAIGGASGISRAAGGGGGGGAGLIYIAARHIVFGGSSALSAKGGDGGHGSTNNGTGWSGVGGAGGTGGRIVIICESYSGTAPTPDVSGGLGGKTNGTGSQVQAASGEYTLIALRG